MKFVVLTQGTKHALILTKTLIKNGIDTTVVIPCCESFTNHTKDSIGYNQFAFYTDTKISGYMNSSKMERQLTDIHPDYILSCGSGNIKTNLIQTSINGVLLAHPGFLPWFRGEDAVGGALQHSYPVGSTVCFLNNDGMYGDIIERRILKIEPHWLLSDIERENAALATTMLADCATKLNTGWIPKRSPQQQNVGYDCKKLTQEERKHIDEEIRFSGLALTLYEKYAWL